MTAFGEGDGASPRQSTAPRCKGKGGKGKVTFFSLFTHAVHIVVENVRRTNDFFPVIEVKGWGSGPFAACLSPTEPHQRIAWV